MRESEVASSQLQGELCSIIAKTLKVERPILTHLNADTSWLLQLPYPPNVAPPPDRTRYNILIDPWFRGTQTDYHPWFSKQWHAIPSSVQTISALDEALKASEELACKAGSGGKNEENFDNIEMQRTTFIDAVVISYEFTDHMHKETLHEIDPTVPVFATGTAASIVDSWKHFHHVSELSTIPLLSEKPFDWTTTSVPRLPSWIGISRIGKKRDAAYLHSALLLAFNINRASGSEAAAEAIIYTPHGIFPKDVEPINEAVPSIKTLALLHGLHDVTLTMAAQLNLGGHNGLKVQQACGAKYWIGTHDEVKEGGGLVSSLLRRKQLSLAEVIERERSEKGYSVDSEALLRLKNVRFTPLGSGEGLLLE